MAKIRMAKVSPLELHNSNIHRGMFEAHNAHIQAAVDEMRTFKPKDRNQHYYDLSKSVKVHQDAAREHLSRSREFYVSTKPAGSFEPNETHMLTRAESQSN